MFILIRLTQHVSGIIMPIVRRTDYVKNCMWSMTGCVGCSRAGWDTSCVHCVKVGMSRNNNNNNSVTNILLMNEENCALKLVDEIILHIVRTAQQTPSFWVIKMSVDAV